MEKTITKEEALKILADERRKRVQKQLDESAEVAAETTHTLLTSEDVPAIVRLNAAKDILDRAGFKPPDKHIVATIPAIVGMKFLLDE